MRPQSTNADAIAAELATRAQGIATRDELLAAGLSPAQVKRRVQKGALIPEYPGVYRVGHAAPSAEASYMAAVKACGPGAGLSGPPASWFYGLIKGRPPPPEVSTPNDRRIKGLATRHRRLHPGELTTHRGISITSVALTLLDLAASLAPYELGRACHEAGFRYRSTPAQVAEVLRRRPNAKGAAKLRAILGGEPIALSRLEERFLALLRAEGLPLPLTNRPAGGRRVDCRWPEHGLTVELDSYAFHNSRHAWEADRARERQAYARGDEFRRYTYGDVFERPRPMLGELRRVFAGPT